MATAVKEHFVEGLSFDADRLEQRKKTLGASDIAAVAGLDPHKTALDVFVEKRGLVEPFSGNEFTMWGLLLEEPIAKRYGLKHAVAFEQPGTLVHPDEPWISATPDRIVVPGDGARFPLEIKNKSVRQATQFGESGTDQVPFIIGAQVHWQMVVLRANGMPVDFADVAVLFGGNEYRDFRVPFRDAIADQMLQIARHFWKQHIETGIAPDVDGSDRAHEYLAETFRQHSEQLRDATPQDDALVRRLKKVRSDIAALDEDKSQIEATLKARIADAAGIQGRNWRVTWKKSKDSQVVDHASVGMELRTKLALAAEALREINPQLAVEIGSAYPQAIERFTTTREGSRRFLPSFPKED